MKKIIKELKNDSVKENHLKEILQAIGIKKEIKELILKDFLDTEMLQFEKRINDIISQAASQMILESMLNKIKEFWSTQSFEFF